MKLAIVIGHNAKAQGAQRITDGRTEFDWNGDLAGMIRDHDPSRIKVFKRTKGGGYSAEIDRVYALVDKWGATASMELHFNANGNASASGGETLSSGTDGSMELATRARYHVADALGNKDRGVKVKSRSDRGGRSLHAGRAPAILTEPYFGSNKTDCIVAAQNMDELAEAYYRAALAFHGEKTQPTPAPNPLAALINAILAAFGRK